MKRRFGNPIFCAATALAALACGGDAESESVGAKRGIACAPDQTLPCTCPNGTSGTQKCQLDKTFSVCDCDAASAAAARGAIGSAGTGAVLVPAVPVSPPAAGSGASVPPGMGTMPPPPAKPPAVPPMPATPQPVIVPPEDVMVCNGMGVAPAADEQVEVLKIRTSDVVPGGFKSMAGTTYACFWIEIDMPEKRHIVGWEGAVGGDRTVHHQQVSLGAKPFYLLNQGGLCGLPSVEYTWTGERPPEWTPGLAGYPIGGPENGGKARFLWQTHFEGATTYAGGFNAYVTKKLRKYDAGNFEQGDVRGIMIPPKAAATHVAKCTPDMTKNKLSHPIYVFSSMLHAHLTVRKIKSEQFRDGKLLTTLGSEMATGFAGFFDQTFHPHTPCIQILPGDELITTCEYQNPWDATITGGEATNQEMCTTFMQYFPRLPAAERQLLRNDRFYRRLHRNALTRGCVTWTLELRVLRRRRSSVRTPGARRA